MTVLIKPDDMEYHQWWFPSLVKRRPWWTYYNFLFSYKCTTWQAIILCQYLKSKASSWVLSAGRVASCHFEDMLQIFHGILLLLGWEFRMPSTHQCPEHERGYTLLRVITLWAYILIVRCFRISAGERHCTGEWCQKVNKNNWRHKCVSSLCWPITRGHGLTCPREAHVPACTSEDWSPLMGLFPGNCPALEIPGCRSVPQS